MSEVIIEQGWESEPETIRQSVVWPFEVSRAVAKYAEQIHSTPIEVITEWVTEALREKGYLGDNGNGRGPQEGDNYAG